MSAETHNKAAPELVKSLIAASKSEGDAMVLLESVVLGVFLYYRPTQAYAVPVFLSAVAERVMRRMSDAPRPN